MTEQEQPRTRLAQLLRQQHVTLEEFRKNYQRDANGTALSERQAYRWVTGELRGLPYPQAQAALHRLDDAHLALARAADARDRVQPDELDSLGGVCTFSRPRQLYYAADALSWGGRAEADRAERRALDALDAYAGAPAQDRAFGGVAGTRSALTVARVHRGEIDGAAEALAPVLKLPVAQRIHGIVTSVEHVRTALRAIKDPGRDAINLAGAIEGWTAERLTLPE
ncbi:MAG: hypothetical protein ACRDRS_15690 [Pseudonocardiaceae bacterium]